MSRNQIIAIAVCSLLLIGLYLFVPTKKPMGEGLSATNQGHAQPQAAEEKLNIEEYIADINAKITDKPTKEQIEKLNANKDYQGLMGQYRKLDKPLALAYYAVKQAEVENQAEPLVAAGDYNSMLLQSAPDDKSRRFLNENALECYKKAVELDTSNVDNRIRLAGAYMTEGSQPMQGVGMLLEIVKKDSNNVDAQLMLGRFGLISGQIEKAIARLEKVLYLQPQNLEALLLLAQAYENKGDKQRAIELLEKGKKVAKDPQEKQQIENYIQNIKKPKG